MSEILFQYQKVYPTTWAYLSSLLMIGLFFKFNRFWSVRNADLVLLILLTPGLLLVHFGRDMVSDALESVDAERTAAVSDIPPADASVDDAAGDSAASTAPSQDPESVVATLDPQATIAEQELARAKSIEWLGFVWLLAVGLLLLIRLLVDPQMVRRPLLEPNLTTGGLAFIGCSLFVFLMANVIASHPSDVEIEGARQAERLLSRDSLADAEEVEQRRHGPGYWLLTVLPHISTMPLRDTDTDQEVALVATAKTMAIVSHLAIVLAVVAIGYRHFGNIRMGIGAATLYLMLPYTALMTGRIDHAAPAALLTWAVLCYRRPLTAGIFVGMAAGVIYYPLWLLPLWLSFYWQRGLMRFVIGLFCSLAAMVLGLALAPGGGSFVDKLVLMFGVRMPLMDGLEGIWGLGWDPVYRIPVIFAFLALSMTFAIWPAQKNLGTLLSCSAALMVAAQCWHGFGGGLFMAWYLPLALLTMFRPNLEDRVALTVLSEGWFPRRRRAKVSETLAA